MQWRLLNLSITTTVLSATVAVTVAVVLLGVNMYETVDKTASVGEDLAYGLARDVVNERGKFLELSIKAKLFRPIIEVVQYGSRSAQLIGGGSNPMGWNDTMTVVRNMLVHLQSGTTVFPEEGWFLSVVNDIPVMSTKAFLAFGKRMLMISQRVTGGSNLFLYTDRYPSPTSDDLHWARFWSGPTFKPHHKYTRPDMTIGFMWSGITLDEPTGGLQMGYGGPILKSGTLTDNLWVYSETLLALLRPLLQSIIGGGEPLLFGEYNNTQYKPVLNETILCVLEEESGLLVECSHGYANLNISGVFKRVAANESEHPIIGPGVRAAAKNPGNWEGVFGTSGSARFPLPGNIRYFIDIEPLTGGPLWSRVVITPYDALLKEVEEHTEKEREGAMETIIFAIVLAVVVTAVAIMAAGYISVKISRPITDLVHDMRRVELLDMDGITTNENGPVSIVREVEEMKRSFLAMVRMMVEYKSFIPSHLVVEEYEESSEESDVKSRVTSAASKTTNTRKSAAEHVRSLFALELSTRQCSMGSFVLERGKLKDCDLARDYNTVLEEILAVSAGMGPHLNLTFDSVSVCFNAATRLMSFAEKGLKVMDALCKKQPSLVVGCSYETGAASVGNVGTSANRFYAVCPDKMVRSRCIPHFATEHGTVGEVYCSASVTATCKNFYFLDVELLNAPGEAQVKVSRLVGEKATDTEEWMYSLQETENLPHAKFNAAFREMVSGGFDSAKKGFESCKGEYPEECNHFLSLMVRHAGSEGDANWYCNVEKRSVTVVEKV
eukprot:TRINITY_DN2403_c3_g3_i1.p1 TRINITY_DN2403_c3_g3~~TRINITY_DN2403_c3_g3_i1.p1  ORF type:complete len:779 (+),score=204.26 TRINITY_DN2403_c3_g3_i1:76-2412(+)